MSQFTYNTGDFPTRRVNQARFESEIRASSIVVALDHIDLTVATCTVFFKADLSNPEQATLDGLVAVHSGEPLPPTEPQRVTLDDVTPTAEKRLPTAATRPVYPKLTFITPNWCDKTTWYSGAAYVAEETATDSGDHTTYSLAHQNVIDAYHGKITFEDNLKDSEGRGYRVVIKVNGTTKTEQDPHLGSGGDYTVNYAAGTVTFLTPLQPGDVVTVWYHYALVATFVIKPAAGKRLYIGSVEVQFSEDIVLNDTFVFQAYGYVEVFAPELMQPPYNLPLHYLIPLGDPLVYKTMVDLLNDSNSAHPGYPKFGGDNWRALKKPAYIFTWEYAVGLTCLWASYGMEIHIDLQHDVPCGGAFGTATLYCTSEDE